MNGKRVASDTRAKKLKPLDSKASQFIEIRGARTHNLKNVDLDIPRGKLTVITGVSGSGKSSLAFDTLFAEGQRQYMESLSSYARQFLDQLERPDVDSIRGLQPALCIDQQQGLMSPRSTVGTVTEIHDYLRLLMARVATPACHLCGQPIDRQPPGQIVEVIVNQPEGTKLTLLAPMVIGRKGAHADVFERISKAGLLRVRVDGELYEIESLPVLAVRKEHTISAIVDRVVLREDSRERIEQAVSVALRLSNGLVEATSVSRDGSLSSDRLYSTRFACVGCGVSLLEIEPRTFSFNSPYGACPTCQGFGYVHRTPDQICGACNGQRLRKESLAIKLQGLSIAEITCKSLEESARWFKSLQLDARQSSIAKPIVQEIDQRLKFLSEVGLSYLSLDRPADTLSGGELQRVRLATSIGTGLIGVCYVLDEPSVGLHPSDTQNLIASLRSLQQHGNTVVVVEHDEEVMMAADLLVDIGPGAGVLGGTITAVGPPNSFADGTVKTTDAGSVTAQYLSRNQPMPHSRNRPVLDEHPQLRLTGITKNNLTDVNVEIPLGRLVGITGVSGSGKSTLIHDSLSVAVRQTLQGTEIPIHIRSVEGLAGLDKLIEIDQSPIGRSPRSIPATYCGFWDEIRKVYAKTRDAKQRGYNASRFSFNSGDGRCEACGGQGRQKLEMSFLADVYVPCPQCRGRRFNRATLAVRFKDKSIADCLDMSLAEAAEFFDAFPKISRSLQCLVQVGLGYVALGQTSTTFSGGEAQRIKLANELSQTGTGKTLYLLDEPTTGLHVQDFVRLINVLQSLVDRGNSVIVVEHQMDLIRCCDWVIDMGPAGGSAGGQIIGAGPPRVIAENHESPTGRFLHRVSNVP
jgi:excinuclease ABC subunit A